MAIHEDVIRFRDLANSMIKMRMMSKQEISKEVGISHPTLAKVLSLEKEEDARFKASIVASFQGFLKRHSYKYFPDPVKIKNEKPIEKGKSERSLEFPPEIIRENFYSLLQRIIEAVPNDITFEIIIKPR